LEKYYQDSTQATVFLRSKFQDSYDKLTNERHLFTASITDFQEETLMALVTYKDLERWYDKTHQAVQKGRDIEEQGIRVLRDNNIDWIKKVIEYWVKMTQEPQREIQEKWVDCKKRWVNINRYMKDIGLLEFDSPEDFVDPHFIVKQHVEQDSTCTTEITKVVSMEPCQVHQFMERPIKARAIL
jgi:hypothetical protein